MRICDSGVAMTLCLLLTACAPSSHGQWKNSLRPSGASAGEVTLVTEGKPVATILISADAGEPVKKAAEELRHWIKELTTATLEITTSDAGTSVKIVHDPGLGHDGIRIGVEDGDLVLAGGTGRGVVNAVYALLEEDLGCRFYTNESIRLPASPTLVIRPVARIYTPQLKLRDPYYHLAFDPTWSLRNRTNAPSAAVGEEFGGRIDYDGHFVHSHAALLPAATYFSDHPEYFALDANGNRYQAQLCATEPEVARLVTEQVLATLKEHPHTELVSVSKNDNAGDQICHCERCKSLRAAEGGSDIACQLVLVNAVAEAVEQSHPHVVVDTLAYLETVQPPKTMRPRGNVVIRLCNDSVGAWSRPFTPARECAVAQVIEAWSLVHNRLSIWDYNVNFSHYLAPMPNIDIMADNIRFWAEHNAEGVMLQGGYQGPAEQDELKCWVTSKLLWDPARDEQALVQDFIWGHYGAAAPALVEHNNLLTSLRTTHATVMATPPGGIRYPMEAPFLTKEFLDGATASFAKAKQLAAGDTALLRRIDRAELPLLYVKCSRGPEFVGEGYAEAVANFERIGRDLQLSFLQEGAANFEPTVAEWKAKIPPAPAAGQ
jgi:hypothetical protein